MPGKKLLVADDSLTIQKVIRLALSNEGYEIQAVSDGNDALQQISLFRPDVVLVDVSLPGQDAFTLKRSVNAHSDLAVVRFVLMSSAFEKVDEVQASEVEFHGRLTKPFDPAHLRQVIQDVLAQVPEREPAAPPSPKTSSAKKPAPAFTPPPLPTSFAPPPLPSAPESDDDVDHSADSWNAPSEMHDLPIMAPPPPETVSELWEPPGGSEDIRNLTESTIRMSGLDDFQWSIKEPSLKPLPSMTDTGGATFVVEPPSGFSMQSAPVTFPDFAHSEDHSSHEIVGLDPSPAPGAQEAQQIDPQMIREMVQKQVQEQVQEQMAGQLEAALQKLTQKLLPEVAERVIKQEIHRILSEMN